MTALQVVRASFLGPRPRLLPPPPPPLAWIYRSLIGPYISYALIAWAQAANSSLNKILTFLSQKRALRLMYFSDRRANVRQVWCFASEYAIL